MAITRARTTDGIKLTFSLDLDRPVSVVGDFNGWDPAAHPLKPRTNGKRSVVVTLPTGGRATFRYLADGGHFFDDPDADGYEDNGFGGTHGVVVLAPPPARRTPSRKPAAPAPAAEAAAPPPAADATPTDAPAPKKAAKATRATTAGRKPAAAKPAAVTKATGRKPKA